MRAEDPFYEVGLRTGGHKMEDRIGRPLRLQWREYKNVRLNAGIRPAVRMMTAPLRWGRARSQR